MTWYARHCRQCGHRTDQVTQCGRSDCDSAGVAPHQHCPQGCICTWGGCQTDTISVVVPTCGRCDKAPAAQGQTNCRDCGQPSTIDINGSQLMSTTNVLQEIIAERARQDEKWGEQNHPDGTGPDIYWGYAGPASYVVGQARYETQTLAQTGDVTWLAILLEEVTEAFAEDGVANLRAELVQIVAVAVAWVEAIDRRGKLIDEPLPYPMPEGATALDGGGWYAGRQSVAHNHLPVRQDYNPDRDPCAVAGPYLCTEDAGHGGWHVATITGSRVVAVWR